MNRFLQWLMARGLTPGTASVYASAVRRGLAALGTAELTQVALDAYAASLSTTRRNAFRSAWRLAVQFGASEGRSLPSVSPGRLGRPSREALAGLQAENYALAYLTRSIDPNALLTLRWADVSYENQGPADAVLVDHSKRRRYHVHRRVLAALLRWGRSDGQPIGALVPDERDGRGWMAYSELIERIESARSNVMPIDPMAAFLLGLPPPRVESF